MSDVFAKLFGHMHRLLKPMNETCLACGKSASLARELPGICYGCSRQIPWIVNPRCLQCGRGIGCPDCNRFGMSMSKRSFILNRSAVTYDAQMREWLAQYKYRGNERYAPLLAEMLLRAYALLHRETNIHLHKRGLKNPRAESWNIHAITSVPVSEERLRERGFNQAEVLAHGLAFRIKLPYVRLLERKRHTDKQSFKSRMDRLKDMEGVFGAVQHVPDVLGAINRQAANRIPSPAGTSHSRMKGPFRILLVDDIYTTGSTINACAEVLRSYEANLGMPIEIYSLTWARS
ncbi:amidophosphoribosyltransferase-like protein [Paenibacillus sp. FSL R5-808]|nr:amidophosphoribosyltransferase-like protein [Paenibacillus sp. FSL R5-808]